MVELLGTYTAENASDARDDAHRCILAALADPNTFLLDPLLSLKPVSFMRGELIHDLLSIFVSEKLKTYQEFYQSHKEYVHSLGKHSFPRSTKHNLNCYPEIPALLRGTC